jgi:hypothetical protein
MECHNDVQEELSNGACRIRVSWDKMAILG